MEEEGEIVAITDPGHPCRNIMLHCGMTGHQNDDKPIGYILLSLKVDLLLISSYWKRPIIMDCELLDLHYGPGRYANGN